MVLLALGLIGCTPASVPIPSATTNPTVIVSSPPSQAVIATPSSPQLVPSPPQLSNWLSPAKVIISNFHSGATAEYLITFHNAKQMTTDQKRVTTGDRETAAEIPLNSAGLYLDNISSVVSVSSDNPREQLQVIAYNKSANSIMISGFLTNSTRVLTTSYKPMTAYSVYFQLPDTGTPTATARMAQDWVMITDSTLVMSPLETVTDLVSVSMPDNVTAADKQWEFWIGVSEDSKSSGVGLSLVLVSRWLVNMR